MSIIGAHDLDSQRTKLAELCQQLRELPYGPEIVELARKRQQMLASYDVHRWFVPTEFGGFGWKAREQVEGYLEISSACLSTAFVLTQRTGAVNRIAASTNDLLKSDCLPGLAAGKEFATVGISHLTTSHRHLGNPVLKARKTAGGFELNGFSPWVTGVSFADSVVVGATCDDGTEILAHVLTDQPGVSRPPLPQLVALTDSCTGEIRLENVLVPNDRLVAGPAEKIMSSGSGGNTGGLQTSTLAIGLSRAAIDFIEEQSATRAGFHLPLEHLKEQYDSTRDYLFSLADGSPECSNESLRSQANSLVLRSTQAALMVAKGAGYREGHPVGRWCREALFFLVWSCPQIVADANLCELAQIAT